MATVKAGSDDSHQRRATVRDDGGPLDFSAFFEQHADRLERALTLDLGDADLAADAVAEAMVRAHQRWWRIAGSANPAGWVYRVALNWARGRQGRRWREVFTADPPEGEGRQLWARDTGRGALLVVPDGPIVTMPDCRQWVRSFAGSEPRWLVASSDGVHWIVEQSPDQHNPPSFPETPPAVAGRVAVVPGAESWLVYDLG